MKLLIVDDESLTRSGVASSIPWEQLGIDQVLEAEDGLAGLELARRHRPEIILSDVRMPRMDGISMAAELEKELPDTCVIFMSGYSDKEYLKAAIRLQAVHYIEKPLQTEEITDAVLRARSMVNQRTKSRAGASLQSRETGRRLARLLTEPWADRNEELHRLCAELSLTPAAEQEAGVLCCALRADPETEGLLPPAALICERLEASLPQSDVQCLSVTRRSQYQIFFLVTSSPLSASAIARVRSALRSSVAGCGRLVLAMGEPVQGLAKAYVSYTSAFLLLQSAYFFPDGTFLPFEPGKEQTAPESETPLFPTPEELSANSRFVTETLFQGTLTGEGQPRECDRILEGIHACFSRSLSALPNQALDLYYNLFRVLQQEERTHQFTAAPREGGEILDRLQRCFSYEELHRTLTDRTAAYFETLSTRSSEQPVIRQIRDFIADNYGNEALSVKDISAHVSLSASYVCTVFKNETGQTLNQYLTDYRMEKARALLLNPKYKITDVSVMVGYRDGNYFGKSFKKHTGFSPSEYREQH